jgi:dihydrofolate reductase
MPRLTLDITMSLDGFIAGPNRTLEKPLGEGADHLHDWLTSLDVFRERHGGSGGVTNDDSAVVEEQLASTGAVIMGRRMFSGGAGPWADDPNAGGWWGDDPPFRVPIFVLTRHAREPVVKQGGTTFTFVTGGMSCRSSSAAECASSTASAPRPPTSSRSGSSTRRR